MKKKNKRTKTNTVSRIFKRYILPWTIVKTRLLVLFLVVLLVIINSGSLQHFFSNFSIEQWELLRRYIQTLFSWPAVILIVSLIFIFRFSNSIKTFLENSNFIKAGPVEMGQKQPPNNRPPTDSEVKESLDEKGVTLDQTQLQQIEDAFQELLKDKEAKDIQINNKDNLINFLFERSELFEFSYLNLYLVQNTKTALSNINRNPCTKDYFISSFQLFSQIPNPLSEKEAIFSVLLVNELIEKNGEIFNTTEKGKRFLKFIGMM